MKHISVKMTDEEYRKVERRRGDKTKSEYVRMLLAADEEHVKKEATDFQQLFADVNLIKETLTASFKDLPNQKSLIALAEYLKRVISIANPPAYAHHETELQQHLQTLKTNISREG